MVVEPPVGRVKAEIGGNHPLQDVSSEHLELRAGSGLEVANPMDVGVRDGAKTGAGVEKPPEMAGDVPVRYAPGGAAQGSSGTGSHCWTE